MKTHIFDNNSCNWIVAPKGTSEAFMNVCNLTATEKQQIEEANLTLATDGY